MGRLVKYDDKTKKDRGMKTKGNFVKDHLLIGLSIKEIAKKYGCCEITVRNQLKKQNCPIKKENKDKYKIR